MLSMGLIFWILMIIWAVFGLFFNYQAGPWGIGNVLLLFVLFTLLGWHVFGAPIGK